MGTVPQHFEIVNRLLISLRIDSHSYEYVRLIPKEFLNRPPASILFGIRQSVLKIHAHHVCAAGFRILESIQPMRG
jgi:hypothetical protein